MMFEDLKKNTNFQLKRCRFEMHIIVYPIGHFMCAYKND